MTSLDRQTVAASVEQSVARRRRFERLFQGAGLFSVCLALLFLASMLVQITNNGIGAFRQTYIYVDIEFDPRVLAMVDPTNKEQLSIANFEGVIASALQRRFPEVKDFNEKRALSSLISVTSSFELRDTIASNPSLMRKTRGFWLLADDDIDTYFKSLSKGEEAGPRERLSREKIQWIDALTVSKEIKVQFNKAFFSSGDSAEPESAGILGAVKGSLLTLLITLILSFPIGVGSALYLEEYAPKNRFVGFVEVNIHNLAAVPSVIYGLLGLAIFINWFGLPRSTPLVGGMVLTLMTLPTIIITSRAAIHSVPKSIRDAAHSIGASKMQVIIHHVLPMALPGMLTGTIIGMAQALGETAPLLMIGMVAFIADTPNSVLDSATVLPVQIFLWASAPEQAFVERSSAAIMVLLVFLMGMNAFAVWLRSKVERRRL